MVSFALTDADRAILNEAKAQADLAFRHAREFEHDEDRMLPHAFPEAEGRPETRAMLADLEPETSQNSDGAALSRRVAGRRTVA